jgi:hypothetical protein
MVRKIRQVPIEDLDLVLRSGSAEQAWINPQGGHLGREQAVVGRAHLQRGRSVPWFREQLK